jgi:hypothetical protein
MKRVLVVMVVFMASGVVSANAKYQYQNQYQIPTCWLLERLYPAPNCEKGGLPIKRGIPICDFNSIMTCIEFVPKRTPTKYSARCVSWWCL